MDISDYDYRRIDNDAEKIARFYSSILDGYATSSPDIIPETLTAELRMSTMKMFYMYRMFCELLELMKTDCKPHISREVTDRMLNTIVNHPAVISEHDKDSDHNDDDREQFIIVEDTINISLDSRNCEEQNGIMEDIYVDSPVVTFKTHRPDPSIHGNNPRINMGDDDLRLAASIHPNVDTGDGKVCIGGDFALHSAIEYRDIPLILTCLDDFLSQYNSDDCYWNPERMRNDEQGVEPCAHCDRGFLCSLCWCEDCPDYGTDVCEDCEEYQMPARSMCRHRIEDIVDNHNTGQSYDEIIGRLYDCYCEFDDTNRIDEHFGMDLTDDEIPVEDKPEIEEVVQWMKDDLKDYLDEEPVDVANAISDIIRG